MKKSFLKNDISYFIIFILVCNIHFSSQLSSIEVTYPVSLQLLDSSNVIATSDGLYFYSQDLSTCTKGVDFTIELNDLNNIVMAQFPHEHEGYILILVKNILYIFDKNKNKKSEKDLNEYIINGKEFNIIPYTFDNNNLILYFFISYLETNNFFIQNITYYLTGDILNQNKFQIDVKRDGSSQNINHISCLLLNPSSIIINHELLTCFGAIQYEVFSITLDPKDNFNELESFTDFITSSEFGTSPLTFVKSVHNKNKEKAFIYVVDCNYPFHPHIGTFDYINKLSSFKKESLNTEESNGLTLDYYINKVFYFSQTEEFVVVSDFNNKGCKKFVMVFHNDCTIYYKGIIAFDNECYNSNSFIVFFNGFNYTILVDGENSNGKSFINFSSELEEMVRYEQETEMIATTYIEPPTTILTTYIEIPTTILTTYIEPPTTILTTYIEPPTTILTTYIEPPTTILTTYIEPPTTILTTYIEPPTTILTAYIEPPTTILTTYIEPPTTILTTYIELPTTILTTYIEPPTTILTTYIELPTTILTTYIELPTTILTTYKEPPTTILTTYIEPPTTILTTYLEPPTSILTTYIESPTSILTTYIEFYNPTNEITDNILDDPKCKISSIESAKYNLCISCNKENNYFPAFFPKNDFLHGFIECYNNITKPINFYFDNLAKVYKPCYETCLTCNEGGNSENNKCLTCDINYIKKPEFQDTNNCVTKCFYSYYYNSFGQYKCTKDSHCPPEANLYIKDLNKCTNNCKNEKEHQYQYGGQCFKVCPKNTSSKDNNNICMDDNWDTCSKSESEIEFQESGSIDFNAKNYAKEFSYTIKHVSAFYNNTCTILLYKDINCIEELSINMPKIDFGDCLQKVKNNLQPPSNDSIIIALIKNLNEQGKSTTSYSFYHPETGEKLNEEEICKDDEIEKKESVISQINNSEKDLKSIIYLAHQDINIFSLTDEFYTDICYPFNSPNGKDIPLKDRVKAFYPNITLCENGCNSKGVNLTTMESICQCKFSDLMNNELIGDNVFFQNTFGEITDLISSSNIMVLKCYKNVFKKKFILKGTGGFIILSIIILEIIFAFFFIINDMNKIIKYLYNLTEYFLLYNSFKSQNPNVFKKSNLFEENSKMKSPPKKINNAGEKLIYNRNKKKNITKKNVNNNSKSLNSLKNEVLLINQKNSSLTSKSTKKMSKEKLLFNDNSKNDNLGLAKLNKAKLLCDNIDMEDYLKQDLDDMEYDDALKLDKRDFCEFFIEKFKQKQIIMDTFFNKENLIPISIKIILLLLNIDLYFVINGLFFNEEYISELFNSDKKETFFSFFPRSISRFFYATLVSFVVGIIIDCIFIEEKK